MKIVVHLLVVIFIISIWMPIWSANSQDDADWHTERLSGSKITKSELMRMLEAHKAWIATTLKKADPKEGYRLQLRGADLTGENLKSINLRGADLRGADLKGANLKRAELVEVDLRGADLQGAELMHAKLFRADLRRANLQNARLNFADLRRSDLRQADFRGANLISADISEAKTQGSKLERAILFDTKIDDSWDTKIYDSFKKHPKWFLVWVLVNRNEDGIHAKNKISLREMLPGMNLSEVYLRAVNLSGTKWNRTKLHQTILTKADLNAADLSYTDLSEANLNDVNLIKADLRGADLRKAVLRNADLTEAKLSGVIFEPKAGFLPDIAAISSAEGFSELQYKDSPHALIELREAFKRAGLLAQEREITYAIKHSRRRILWDAETGENNNQKKPILWRKFESVFNLIFFELTCLYGMKPGRPLILMLMLIFILTVPYTIVLKWPPEKDGIWKMWLPDRARKQLGQDEAIRLRLGFLSAVKTGFFFSILSAFSIGWREVNVRTWIVRLQRQEYMLRATGWVRTLSGLQSLISVYFLALWILTYFGRLFETV